MALPYVGSKISLISHAEIRYEGTLHEIDKINQTVSLVNVRSFGTEGRRTDLHIKPAANPFSLIVFRGQDIKDLNVQQPTPDEDPAFQDPAILSHVEAATPLPPPVVVAASAGGAAAPALSATAAGEPEQQRRRQQQQQGEVAAAAAAEESEDSAQQQRKGASPQSLAQAHKQAAAARRKKKDEEAKATAEAAAAAKAAPKDDNLAVKKPTAEDWAQRTASGRFHPTRLNHRWKQEQSAQIQPQQQLQQQLLLPQQQQLLEQPHRQNGGNSNINNRPGMGGFVGAPRGPPRGPRGVDANIDVEAEASAALEVEKEKYQKELAAAQDDGPKYDPSNFFDNLGSGSTVTKDAPVPGRPRRNDNALNRETFGAPQQPPPPRLNHRFVPQQPTRPPHPQHGDFYRKQPAIQAHVNHNRYGGHNRTGHHNFQRSQGQQNRGPQQRY